MGIGTCSEPGNCKDMGLPEVQVAQVTPADVLGSCYNNGRRMMGSSTSHSLADRVSETS